MNTDPISDLLTRIRNGQRAEFSSVRVPSSNIKRAITEVLKAEGYIEDFRETAEGARKTLEIQLKYHEGEPVIEKLSRISSPGLRKYRGHKKLPRVVGGLGVAIVSTSKGVMSDREARRQGLGGEVLCVVS